MKRARDDATTSISDAGDIIPSDLPGTTEMPTDPVGFGVDGKPQAGLTDEQIEEVTHLLRAGRRLPPYLLGAA
jgi:hypothetical protein